MAKQTQASQAPEAIQDAPGEVTETPEQAHYSDYKVNPETGVIEQESYHFPEYTVGGKDAVMPTDIHHLFAEGFKQEQSKYHFTWCHFSKVGEVGQRFFTPCRKEYHARMFKAGAWDKTTGGILAGWDPKAGRKELVLCVRSAKANDDETKQMLAISQDVNDPLKGERATEQADKFRNMDPRQVKYIGQTLTHGVESRWK